MTDRFPLGLQDRSRAWSSRPDLRRAQGGRVIAAKPIKHSVALVIRKRDVDTDVLLVRRPDDDDEFPGMWGLPAASCRDGEGTMAAALRIGVSKLGTQIEIGQEMGVGSQEREGYVIEMTLLGAFLADCSHITLPRKGAEGQLRGVTVYTAFRWGPSSDLSGSAAAGSLCSQLLLADKGLTW